MGFDPADPLGRTKGELATAHQALIDYALLGTKRSLQRLARIYVGEEVTEADKKTEVWGQLHGEDTVREPPTKYLRTIENWSVKYAWQDRVALYDMRQIEAQIEAVEEVQEQWRQRRQQMLEVFYLKLMQALVGIDFGSMGFSLSQLTGAVTNTLQEARAEFEDMEFVIDIPQLDRLITSELERLAGSKED